MIISSPILFALLTLKKMIKQVTVTLQEEVYNEIESRRGKVPRSIWINDALFDHMNKEDH